jgi:hypothetical protein
VPVLLFGGVAIAAFGRPISFGWRRWSRLEAGEPWDKLLLRLEKLLEKLAGEGISIVSHK